MSPVLHDVAGEVRDIVPREARRDRREDLRLVGLVAGSDVVQHDRAGQRRRVGGVLALTAVGVGRATVDGQPAHRTKGDQRERHYHDRDATLIAALVEAAYMVLLLEENADNLLRGAYRDGVGHRSIRGPHTSTDGAGVVVPFTVVQGTARCRLALTTDSRDSPGLPLRLQYLLVETVDRCCPWRLPL